MAEHGLFVAVVLETIYDHLDPTSRKNLSATCTAARAIYRYHFFANGVLIPKKMRLGGPTLSEPRCMCIKRKPMNALLGMRSFATISTIAHCGNQRCKNYVITESYHNAIKTLLVDGGTGLYLPPATYEQFLDKACKVASFDATAIIQDGACTTRYAKMRVLHDTMISAFVENAIGASSTTAREQPMSPKYSLMSDWVTFDHLRIGDKKRKIGNDVISYVITSK